jgi:hypothetical protein
MPLEPVPKPSVPATGITTRLLGWLRQRGWRPLVLGAAGAIAGGAYAQLIGCRTGGCAILSNVGSATVAGALVGLMFGWPAPSKPT